MTLLLPSICTDSAFLTSVHCMFCHVSYICPLRRPMSQFRPTKRAVCGKYFKGTYTFFWETEGSITFIFKQMNNPECIAMNSLENKLGIRICQLSFYIVWQEKYVKRAACPNYSLRIHKTVGEYLDYIPFMKILKRASDGHFTISWGHRGEVVNGNEVAQHDNDKLVDVVHPNFIHTTNINTIE